MPTVILKILGFLVPPDPAPWDLPPTASDKDRQEAIRAMRRWKLGVSSLLGVVVLVLIGSAMTPYGFALAADGQTATQKAIAPLEQTVAKIDERSKENEKANQQMLDALNELRAAAVADNLDRLVRRRCVETDVDELTAIRRSLQDMKVTFASLAKREYVEPSCAELRRQ